MRTIGGHSLVTRLEVASSRLAAAARQVTEAQTKVEAALRSRKFSGISACNHPDGHEIKLRLHEAISVEAARECPCCGARLWISIPTVGVLVESVARKSGGGLDGLGAGLSRLERQLVNLLRTSQYPLHSNELATLIWSDETRTHDVRSLLYRVRRKLSGSNWAIPVPHRGQGIRLVQVADRNGLQGQHAADESVEIKAA